MSEAVSHLTLSTPPRILYMAIDLIFIDHVMRRGLNRRKMPFLMMYDNPEDARKHARNPGACYLVAVLAGNMADDAYMFCHLETGEWATDVIPAKYICLQG